MADARPSRLKHRNGLFMKLEDVRRPKASNADSSVHRFAINSIDRSSDRIVTGLGLNRQPPQLGKLVDARMAAKTAPAAVFHAPERHLRFIMHRRAVDVAHPGFDPLRHTQRACGIAAEYGCGQPVVGIVCDLYWVLFVLRLDDRRNGPKNLFLIDPHLRRDAGHHRWLEGRAVRFASGVHNRAFRDGIGYHVTHSSNRIAADQRADLGIREIGISHPKLARPRRELVDEGFCDRAIDNDAIGRHADLALILKSAELSPAAGPAKSPSRHTTKGPLPPGSDHPRL